MNTSALNAPPHQHAPTTLILGTAGHIDHGKSTLVKSLTGVDPDRLPEEKKRGMTIELGFARLDLPNSNGKSLRLGIVDVPGHERFIRTMVAGASGVDLAMLVVAADDGWMPQTQEHAEILNLLGVGRGMVALSKCDLVHDDRLNDVAADIRNRLAEFGRGEWPIVRTAARSGTGLEELRTALAEVAREVSRPAVAGVFRMPLDRVFTVHGRGTVVTGSVISGRVTVDDEMILHPESVRVRVRGVQTHGEDRDSASVGERAAINLVGADRDAIQRGMDLATPDYFSDARYIDVRLKALSRLSQPIPSHCKVRVLMGTREVMATLVLIAADHLAPGQSCFAQLRLHETAIAEFGQRIILRDETASDTIGGATVIRPVSTRLRPNRPEVLKEIQEASSDDPAIRLSAAYRSAGFETVGDLSLACRVGITAGEVESLRDSLTRNEVLQPLDSRLVHTDVLTSIEDRALARLNRHHTTAPNEPGLSRDKFVGWLSARTSQRFGRTIFSRLLSSDRIREAGPFVTSANFRPALVPEDESAIRKIVNEIELAGYDPPKWDKLKATEGLSRQRLRALFDIAKTDPRLIVMNAEQFISASAIDRFKGVARDLGADGRRFTLAEVRDRTGKSRRIVQTLLEYLDKVGVTRRVADERVLVSK